MKAMKYCAVAAALLFGLAASPAAALGSLRHLDFRRSSLQADGSVVNGTGSADEPGVGQGGIPAPFRNDEHAKNTKRRTTQWKKDPAGFGAYFAAVIWVSLVALMPLGLHLVDEGFTVNNITKTQVVETLLVYIWLIGGLYLFTNVLLFQSPHFNGEIRSLSLEEAVYLFSQIITTVGYGDITPAKTRGQLFVGIFVVMSFLLVAGLISQFATIVLDKVTEKISKKKTNPEDERQVSERTQNLIREEKYKAMIWTAATPLMQTSVVFSGFVVVGVVFFSQYPGENKTVFQALYMSMITLSSVGFGAFTPITHVGMVFAAFWMLFGVTSLGAVISSLAALVAAVKDVERLRMKEDQAKEALKKTLSEVPA